jgi:hypothetical protein
MMNVLRSAAIMVLALAGSAAHGADDNPGYLVGKFAGVLPCADCRGIRTELTLYRASRHGLPTGYTLRETYLGTRDGDKAFDSRGQWYVLRGSAANPDATVYQLAPEPAGEERHFLKAGENKLRLLTRDLAELPSAMPHSLTRVQVK